MDLQFVEPDLVPVPPEDVRVLEAAASPYPDGRRVKVAVRLTPFLDRPDVELRIFDGKGGERAQAAVIECVDHEFTLTLHLRSAKPEQGPFRLQVTASYPDRGLQTSLWAEFSPVAPAA